VFQPKVQNGALKRVIDAASNWLDRSAGVTNWNLNRRFEDLETIKGRW
jgi:hypothetical protein